MVQIFGWSFKFTSQILSDTFFYFSLRLKNNLGPCAISLGKCGPVKKLKKAPIVNLSLGEVAAECKRLVIVCSIKPTGGASSLMSHCIPRDRIIKISKIFKILDFLKLFVRLNQLAVLHHLCPIVFQGAES